MKLKSALILLIFLWGGSLSQAAVYENNGQRFSVASTPQWVVSVVEPKAMAKEDKPNGLSVAYLAIDNQIDLTQDKTHQYYRRVMQPLTESGVENAAQIEIDYNPDYQTLTIHSVTVLRGGERSNRFVPEEVKLLQRETDIKRRLYNGTVTAYFILNDVRVDDVVEYEFSVTGTNPVFGEEYFSWYFLGWSAPVEHASVRLLTHPRRKLNYRMYNTEIKPEIRRKGKLKEYIWQVNNTETVIDEGEYPNWYQPYPALQISEYKDWRSVAEWAVDLYDGMIRSDEEAWKKFVEWRDGLSEEERESFSQTLLALKFVQQEIRYFGVEFGQNSHRPSFPADVVSRRYGDCKDKTVLLTAILRRLGVKAWPALVSGRSTKAVANELPSPGAFDHVVVAAEIDGELVWLDGTRRHQTGSLKEIGHDDFGFALLIRDNERQLTQVKRFSEKPRIAIQEEYHIDEFEQPVKLSVTSRYYRDRAETMRAYLAETSQDKIAHSYLNYYTRLFPGVSDLEPVRFENDGKNNIVVSYERYLIKDFFETRDDRQWATVRASSLSDYVRPPKVINREMPLAVYHPIQVQHTVLINFPEGFNFKTDEVRTFEDDAIRFSVREEFAAPTLTIHYEYESKSDVVMPDAVETHIAMLNKISSELNYSWWMSPGVQPQDSKLIDDLLLRLKQIL